MVAKVFVILAFSFIASALSLPADEKKPLDCPPNEKYHECELEVCYKTCEHLVNLPACPSIAAGCYRPACECIDGYLRNKDGTCVPIGECPKPLNQK